MRWLEITEDPNSLEAHEYRNSQLTPAHRPPVPYRDPFIIPFARGKRVLNLGVVDHFLEGKLLPAYLHKAMTEVATECVGVDIVEKGVAALAEQGFDVRVADVSVPGLEKVVGTDYDLVVGGELIEHVETPGVLFENARAVLKPGGRMILTTPNPFCVSSMLPNVMGKSFENVDHIVYYYPAGIAELADRHGWRLVSYRGSRDAKRPDSPKRKLLKLIERFTTEDIACWTYIYELEVI